MNEAPKKWVDSPWKCNFCGSEADINTRQSDYGVFDSGDTLKCLACGATAILTAFCGYSIIEDWNETNE